MSFHRKPKNNIRSRSHTGEFSVDVIVKADPLIKTNSFSRFAKYGKAGANDMVQVAKNEMWASEVCFACLTWLYGLFARTLISLTNVYAVVAAHSRRRGYSPIYKLYGYVSP